MKIFYFISIVGAVLCSCGGSTGGSQASADSMNHIVKDSALTTSSNDSAHDSYPKANPNSPGSDTGNKIMNTGPEGVEKNRQTKDSVSNGSVTQ